MPHISNLSGVAGAFYSPLPPATGPQDQFAQGPFTAELAPAVHVRSVGAYPKKLSIGLLIKEPDSDGVGAKELNHPGYARQSVELSHRSEVHETIDRPVLFDLFDCPAVTSLALFDDDDVLVAHGVLRGRSTSVSPASRFEFPGSQILVRRPLTPAL